MTSQPSLEPASAETTASAHEAQAPTGTRYQWVEAFTVSTLPAALIAGLLLISWGALQVLHGGDDPLYQAWIGGAKVPELIAEGQVWRLWSASLLHLEITHVALNALGVYALGRLTVILLGAQRMIIIVGLTALAGTAASLWLSDGWSLGASGGVFGLLGAVAGALARRRRHVPEDLKGMLSWRVVPWLTLGLAALLTDGANIDHAAHFGALLIGALIGAASPIIPLGARRRTAATWVGLALVLGSYGYGVAGVVLHRQAALRPPEWVQMGSGVSPEIQIEIPRRWVRGESLNPEICARSATDGLLALCPGRLPSVSGVAEARGRLVAHAREAGLRLVPEGEKAFAGRAGGWILALEFAPEAGPGRLRAWLRPDPQGVDVILAALLIPNAGDRWQTVILERARTSLQGGGAGSVDPDGATGHPAVMPDAGPPEAERP